MRPNILTATLALCAAIAVGPLVGWAGVEALGSAGPGWLGALPVTVPIGLGLAAVVLAAHGLVLQRDLADALEEDYAHLAEVPEATAFASVGAPTARAEATATAAAPTAPLPEVAGGGAGAGKAADLGGKAQEKIRTAGKQAGGRVVRRTKAKAKNSVKREVRSTFRDLRPKF